MPDSEDDYDRKNRDKFVREREYGDRPRGFNQDRGRRDYSNGVGVKRLGVRRDEEPPLVKRNRYDSASDSFEPQFIRKEENNSTTMLTFKKFLNTQDETLTDEEAIAKYVEYKMEFKKQECEKYFQEHKDEEWFRLKYHPDESTALKEEKRNLLQKRLDVFNSFVENGSIGNTNLDYLNAANIIRLLDSVVVKLENGLDAPIEDVNDEDLDDESVIEIAKLKEAEKQKSNGDSGDASTIIPTENDNGIEKNGGDADKIDDEIVKKKKSQLHKTCSIFFKTIPLSAKQTDLNNICKQHPGFLRIGLMDPSPDSKLHRHGWVTYRRDVNIKEIFWSLKNAKLNGAYLGAIVNRDLKRKIRPVGGVTLHRTVVQNDVRQAATLIALYDHRARFFVDPEAPNEPLTDLEQAIISSKNPVLDGIVEYLVVEENAEEEALLGLNGNLSDDVKIPLEVDKTFIKVLDKLILYLRIVHSVDYYNCGEYLNEDNMPNRIGILHVRGLPPSKDDSYIQVDKSKELLSKKFVDDFVSAFNERLSSTLLKNAIIAEEELEKLGKKDAEGAVEDFISQNCVELSKEKWLCPLSGKKFKGPEFIHKHLHSKHAEKLNEVRDEVLFFNNYLLDPLRPYNESPKPPSSPVNTHASSNPVGVTVGTDFDRRPNDFGFRNNWNNGGPRGGFGNRGFQGGGNRDFGNRSRYFDSTTGANDNGSRRDPRPHVAYRDLDEPEEIF